MNEKNLLDDITSKSLNELTDLADKIIKNLENEINLENKSEDYANLIKINKLIEQKFQKTLKKYQKNQIQKSKRLNQRKMEKKLNRIVKKTNDYLYRYFSKEKNTDLIKPMLYGLLPGGKKIRSKILFDVGSIFEVDKKIFCK